MNLNQIERTYICQFSKPENKAILEGYKNRRDGSGKELAQYYRDIISILKDTPAYGVSGVNKMLNELTDKVRATLHREKRGKTSAYAHARWLLNKLNYFGSSEARPGYRGRYKLGPILTEDELLQLEAI